MSEKLYTPIKGVRFDKTGGVTDPCFHKGLCVLIDEYGYSGSSLQELGILTALIKHGLLGQVEKPLTAAQQAVVVDLKVRIGEKDLTTSGAEVVCPATQ